MAFSLHLIQLIVSSKKIMLMRDVFLCLLCLRTLSFGYSICGVLDRDATGLFKCLIIWKPLMRCMFWLGEFEDSDFIGVVSNLLCVALISLLQ